MADPIELSIGTWSRFDRYVVHEGMIRPAFDARSQSYDPWPDHEMGRSTSGAKPPPYGALLDLIPSLELKPRPGPGPLLTLTPESETRATEWCAAHGPLGVLLQRVQTVTLAPRWHPSSEADHRLVPVLQQLIRTNQGWIRTGREGKRVSSETNRDDSAVAGELVPPDFRPTQWPQPEVLLQDLRTGDWKTEPLSQTWLKFFPKVPWEERETYAYPLPGTDAFWSIYAEPVYDFVEAANLLRSAIRGLCAEGGTIAATDLGASQNALDWLNRLLGPVGPAAVLTPDGQLQHQWGVSSLLGAYALMALMDLTGQRRPRICGNCGKLFVTKAYQGTYCSDTCRNTVQKRRYRQRQRERSNSG